MESSREADQKQGFSKHLQLVVPANRLANPFEELMLLLVLDFSYNWSSQLLFQICRDQHPVDTQGVPS